MWGMNRIPRWCLFVFFHVFACTLSGCAVVASPSWAIQEGGPYTWTQVEVTAIRTWQFGALTPLAILDLPLSVTLDTVMLPVVLIRNAVERAQEWPKDSAEFAAEVFTRFDLDDHPGLVASIGEVEGWEVVPETEMRDVPPVTFLRVQGALRTRRVAIYRFLEQPDKWPYTSRLTDGTGYVSVLLGEPGGRHVIDLLDPADR